MSLLEKNVLRHLITKGAEPFITGGTVRDRLLGMPVRDSDVVVFGMDESMLHKELERFGQVLTYGKSFRVYQVRGLAVEFSLPRTRENQENLPALMLMQRLQRDAEGRDFTVNALYMNPLTEEIIDPLEGLVDLSMRRLRMTSAHSFEDDPLRVLRAVQLCARIGFSIETKTLEVMQHVSLNNLARERIYEELNKWLLGSDPARGWKIMVESGHIPDICITEKGFRKVISDVLTNAATFRDQSVNPAQWMWGVLLSTCLLSHGQPRQRSSQNEKLHRYIRQFGQLSNHHDHTRIVSESLWGVKNVYDYSVRKPDIARLSLGVDLDELILTMNALKPFWNQIGKLREAQMAMNRIKKMKPHEKPRPLVKGSELKNWGYTEGKTMGILLKVAFQLQLEGVTRKQMEAYFKKYHKALEKTGH